MSAKFFELTSKKSNLVELMNIQTVNLWHDFH